MNGRVERSAEWVYRGVWLVLTDCFRVPKHPPTIPIAPTDFCHAFHPSRRYLSYLKLCFWIALVVIDAAILIGWIALCFENPPIALMTAIPALFIAIVPDIIAYIAIHLRYDTMWYVITDRSLRTRRGVWVIAEHTITFENVQNVYIRRGPIQQLFGISSIVVETAGAAEGESANAFTVGNKAIMEGIGNPEEIRDLIMERVRATKSAGLGDEMSDSPSRWSARHLQILREIRDEMRRLA